MAGVIYRHPRLYDAALRILHGGGLYRRYTLLAEEIGRDVNVLDVGCGTCQLAGYLHSSCRYRGIDLNPTFVEDARRRGLDVAEADAMDGGNYPGDVDVIVLSDVLHHVVPRHHELVCLCKSKAGKVIACEPHSKNGFFNGEKAAVKARIDLLWRFMCSFNIFNHLFGDDDGFNEYSNMRLWDIYVKEKLKELYDGYGMRTVEVDDYLVGVWERC